MRVTYVGPHPEGVTVALTDGSFFDVAYGVPTDVPDEIGANLVAQGTFTESKSKRATGPTSTEDGEP
jgi:hypothetical protein